MEQDTNTLNDFSYQIIKDRYKDGTLSVDASFHATIRLLEDSGFDELGFNQAIDRILSFLEAPDSERLERPSPLSPLTERGAQSHVNTIKRNASKYDGVHTTPQQDDLMGILRHLDSLSEDKSFWKIDRDKNGEVIEHEADRKIHEDRVRMDPDVAKVFARKAEKQKEVTDKKAAVLKDFKRELLDGFYLPNQRQWSSQLKSGTNWIRGNLKGGSEIVDQMAIISTELSKVGYMIGHYGGNLDEVVEIFSRTLNGRIKETTKAPEQEV